MRIIQNCTVTKYLILSARMAFSDGSRSFDPYNRIRILLFRQRLQRTNKDFFAYYPVLTVGTFTSGFQDRKLLRTNTTMEINVFLIFFLLMEGFGSGFRRSKNLRFLRIRIGNTDFKKNNEIYNNFITIYLLPQCFAL